MGIEFVSKAEYDSLSKKFAEATANMAFACHLAALFIDQHNGIAITQEEFDTDTSDWNVEMTKVEDTGHRMYTIDKGE